MHQTDGKTEYPLEPLAVAFPWSRMQCNCVQCTSSCKRSEPGPLSHRRRGCRLRMSPSATRLPRASCATKDLASHSHFHSILRNTCNVNRQTFFDTACTQQESLLQILQVRERSDCSSSWVSYLTTTSGCVSGCCSRSRSCTELAHSRVA